jgi:hypothetical protein
MPAPASPIWERKRRRLGSDFIFQLRKGSKTRASIGSTLFGVGYRSIAKIIPRGTVTTRGRCGVRCIRSRYDFPCTGRTRTFDRTLHAAVERNRRRPSHQLRGGAGPSPGNAPPHDASSNDASRRYSIPARYTSPGLRIADGKRGSLGAFGKPCGSRITPLPISGWLRDRN